MNSALPSPAPRRAPSRRWAAGVAAGLFFACAFVYNLNCREVSEDDTLAVRYLPVSLLREGDLDLDEFPELYRNRSPLPYYLKRIRGHYYARAPFLPAVLALPVYWAAEKAGWLPAGGLDLQYAARFASKVAASLLAAASVAALFLALLRVAAARRAVIAALVYAFATNTWAVASQGLWQHAPSQLCIALTWCFLLPGRGRKRRGPGAYLLAGLAAGLGFGMRPASLPLAAIAAAYALYAGRWAGLAFLPGFLACAAPVSGYNLALFGSLQGGYADLTHRHPWLGRVADPWGGDFFRGFAGLLVCPNRGLLIYTPVALFSLVGFREWLRRDRAAGIALAASALAVVLIGSKFVFWWAGWSFGPRYLMDPLPALALLMAPARGLLRRGRWGLWFAALAAWSVAVQMVGFWCYPAGWNWSPVNVDLQPARLWDWEDTQLRRCLLAGPRPTLWSEWSRAWSNRAIQFYDAGEFEDAAAAARRAIQLDSANAAAYNTLGNAVARQGRLDLAAAAYRAALRRRPRYALAHSNLAVCLLHAGRLEEAVRHLRLAIAYDPSLAIAYRNLGDAYRLAGRRAAARACYEQALRLAPGDALAKQRLAELNAAR